MRRTPCLTLACLLMLLELTLSIARAQGVPDATPPLIEHEPLERSEAATRQTFTAQVVDDRDLLDVTLYHRRQGERAFAPVAMTALADSAFFGVGLETDPQDLRTIEYYLQARDLGGNRTVSGFAFDPWQRRLQAASPALAGENPAGVPNVSFGRDAGIDTPRTGSVRWWHVALGVLAAGTLAALAAGGSDGGGSAGTGGGGDGVPFTITLGEPR